MNLSSILQKKIASFFLFAFMAISFCGFMHFADITDSTSDKSDCTCMCFTGFCLTNSIGHLSIIQSTDIKPFLNLLVLLFTLSLVFLYAYAPSKNKILRSSQTLLQRLKNRDGSHTIFYFLQEAFSKGILNPKYF